MTANAFTDLNHSATADYYFRGETAGSAPAGHERAHPFAPKTEKAIVDGLVAMSAGTPPREFRPPLLQFRASMSRSLQAMGLSDSDAYLQAREIEKRADHELCLIWDNISMAEQL